MKRSLRYCTTCAAAVVLYFVSTCTFVYTSGHIQQSPLLLCSTCADRCFTAVLLLMQPTAVLAAAAALRCCWTAVLHCCCTAVFEAAAVLRGWTAVIRSYCRSRHVGFLAPIRLPIRCCLLEFPTTCVRTSTKAQQQETHESFFAAHTQSAPPPVPARQVNRD